MRQQGSFKRTQESHRPTILITVSIVDGFEGPLTGIIGSVAVVPITVPIVDGFEAPPELGWTQARPRPSNGTIPFAQVKLPDEDFFPAAGA